VRLRDRSIFTTNAITFGYEHQSDRANSKNDDFSFGGPSDIGLVRAHADADAGYAGAQTTLFQRLALTGQVREDATTIAGDAFTWRLGGVLDVPEIATHLKASYGTSFRAPALNDRYGTDNYGFGFGFVGNPNLRPERGQGYEAGFSTDLPATPIGTATIAIEYFHNRIHDLIEDLPLANGLDYSPFNVNSAQTQGVETTLTLRATKWIEADLNYTYTDARNLGTHDQLLRRPYNQASGNLRITPIPGVTIAPELLYTGAFQDYLISDAGEQGFTPGISPSGLIFNLNVTWQIAPHVQVFAWGKNLNNSRFEPVNGYQTPGASALGGVRVGF
jgi:vitamin B12 transporter